MTLKAQVTETIDTEEDGTSSGEEHEISEDESGAPSNAGWADSISRILKTNKPKGKKTLVLSKAKKLTDIKREKLKPAGFEVATADGSVKQEQIVVEEKIEQEPPRKKKKEVASFRVKPNILEKDRERTLTKIATKGVVQLFNAVKMQQKDISKKLEQAGPLEVRKEKVLKSIDKREFLDVLMGEKSQTVDENIVENKVQKEEEGTWNVLRDDFMMGAKLKDWDKELETEMETENQVEIESD